MFLRPVTTRDGLVSAVLFLNKSDFETHSHSIFSDHIMTVPTLSSRAYPKILLFHSVLALAVALSSCATRIAPYVHPTETKKIVVRHTKDGGNVQVSRPEAESAITFEPAIHHRHKSSPEMAHPLALPPEMDKTSPFAQGLPIPSARYSIRLCRTAGQTLGDL